MKSEFGNTTLFKIAGEEKKEFPNHNRIRCWEREVQKYKLQIERTVRRLRRDW